MASVTLPSSIGLSSSKTTSSDSSVSFDYRFDLLCVMTTVLLFFHAPGIWYSRTPLVVFLVCGLIRRELTRLPVFWFCVSGLVLADVVAGWFFVDNHKYVEFYWCFTMFVVTLLPPNLKANALKMNGRLMLGMIMLFAVLWKAISYSYMSGQFFEYVLLTDVRFEHMAHWFGGIDYASLSTNRHTLDAIKASHLTGASESSALLISNDGVRAVAWGMTWWTILIEGAIGVLFLLPQRIPRINPIRDYTLLLFAATTYMFAPVVGFGWLLMMMGIAQADTKRRLQFFCVAFILIQVYEMPYSAIVNGIIG